MPTRWPFAPQGEPIGCPGQIDSIYSFDHTKPIPLIGCRETVPWPVQLPAYCGKPATLHFKGDPMKFLPTLLLFAAVLLPAGSFAGVGPCDYSTAERAYPGPETVVVMVLPDGTGTPLTEARTLYQEVDATITINLLDCLGVPVPGYPSEDMWLESADGGLAMCVAGSITDANTDANGQAFWAQPLRAGGSSEALTIVIVNGAPLTTNAGLAISFNSPDINGDRVVNLTDVPSFATDFYGSAYMFRSDFHYDGTVNLSDVVLMAQGLGADCP